jgi:chemotaxis protein MotB
VNRRRRRASDHGEFHQDERWLITYADMITLLLALFIVLYALSDTNVRKFTAFAQSVASAFNVDVFQGEQAITVTSGQQTVPDTNPLNAGSGAMAADLQTIQATLMDFAVRNGAEKQLSVDRVPDGIAIRISDALLFSSGRATLDDRSRALLQRVVAAVLPLPNLLRIEGHTDDQQPNGPFYTDNWSLSADRAIAVLQAMVVSGISPARLAAAGYGEYHPLVANTDDASRLRNRRVDVLVLYTNSSEQSPAPDAFAPPSSSVGGIP